MNHRFKIDILDFGIVTDLEHRVVASGLYEHMVGLAGAYNEKTQSQEYKAERWNQYA